MTAQGTRQDWRGNSHSVFSTLGATNHSAYERPALDFYATDPSALDALLAEPVVGPIIKSSDAVWECACGNGSLSEALIKHGIKTYSSDIADRGYGRTSVDFLACDALPDPEITAILTNPPYRYATEFILHSLALLPDGGTCAMLLKTQFLEGQERYRRIYANTPPQVRVPVRAPRTVRPQRGFRLVQGKRRLRCQLCVVRVGQGGRRGHYGALADIGRT